eukprot:2973518-Alexandrium_andersonii.AAC.1
MGRWCCLPQVLDLSAQGGRTICLPSCPSIVAIGATMLGPRRAEALPCPCADQLSCQRPGLLL